VIETYPHMSEALSGGKRGGVRGKQKKKNTFRPLLDELDPGTARHRYAPPTRGYRFGNPTPRSTCSRAGPHNPRRLERIKSGKGGDGVGGGAGFSAPPTGGGGGWGGGGGGGG